MNKSSSEQVVLTFDLFDLPTAQHKAGLAGMLLQIESMRKRKLNPRCVPHAKWTPTSSEVTFTEESLQGLFDDVYDAKTEEVAVAGKWQNAKLKGEIFVEQVDPTTKKAKQVKRFLYDVVQPKAPCLADHLKSSEKSPWHKLWRDMVWAVPRGINTTRAPFKERSEDRPCSIGASTWKALRDFETARMKNQFKTASISSALLLGAQDVNAEAVPFEGKVDQNLLLHFWQVVVMTYVPQIVDNDGKSTSKGYVLAIPEVSHLREFLYEFPEMLATLRDETRGFRPTDALIDIPVQAGLEFLRSLRALEADKTHNLQWASCISAIDSFHMEKQGNTIKLLTFERVVNRPGLIPRYEQIKSSFRNPLFRAACLRTLLRNEPWYSGMLELFAERPAPMFVEHEKTPKFLPRFATDARIKFKAIHKDTHDMSAEDIPEPDRLAKIVQRLVNKYVEGRAEAKTGKKAKEFLKETIDGKERRIYPKEFREAQQRVCSDAFLAMRSRHDQDFVEYFVGSICSVAQYLPPMDYAFLTRILMRQSQLNATGPIPSCWEDVKALAMIAVSACSFSTLPRESTPKK